LECNRFDGTLGKAWYTFNASAYKVILSRPLCPSTTTHPQSFKRFKMPMSLPSKNHRINTTLGNTRSDSSIIQLYIHVIYLTHYYTIKVATSPDEVPKYVPV
jgi:hypothetical protein